ncbi:MAG: molybdate ABC transporter permease subunit [Chloroflexi bacterium]|nr:molybdate ABC transporter permease subunit [Chloroflexota bacterium]
MDITALRLSLQIASVSTVLAIIIGVPVALLLARFRFRGRGIISALVLVPMLLPPSVMGFYLLQLVGRQSPVGSVLESMFGFSLVFHWSGAVLAAFVASTPFLIRTAQAGFESVDPRYEEAARTLGRSDLAIFWTVTMPLAWKTLLAGVALALARAMGEFGATLMVAGNIPGRTQTMSIAIYDAVQANRLNDAHVLALTLTLVTLGLLVGVGTLARGGKW